MAEQAPGRLVLVGFMAAGKTTVGGLVARLLGWDFVDMDTALEERSGLSVAEIFRRHGEPYFRARELELAGELAARRGLVVAAGGGAFAAAATRERLRRGATTVWLRCGLSTVLGRLEPDGTRPLASDRERIARLFAEREPSYRLADWTVDAGDGSPRVVARRVVDTVFGRSRPGSARRDR